jgi:hypothetical protein
LILDSAGVLTNRRNSVALPFFSVTMMLRIECIQGGHKMNTFRFVLWPAVLTLLCGNALAADLSKIQRTIGKEPAYHGQPRYCLVVFGPEARTRIWLVLDDAALYVDRNGNGDLSEPEKKVTADKTNNTSEGERIFKIGDVKDGPRLHKNLQLEVSPLNFLQDRDERVKSLLTQNPSAIGYMISVDADIPGWKGMGAGGRVRQSTSLTDSTGILQFSNRVQDAPVIHFAGPWNIALYDPVRLVMGYPVDMFLGIGTPGLCPGTSAYIEYDGVVPVGLHPTIDITYPTDEPGKPFIRERYRMKYRC